ncbi:MAG TPA: hypothetical protein PK079_14105 [Leptospiraceae bacterium]|nr:hypothetical protein [Leptospiraceae bacterium]HMW04150.1 hypothetical protein [Leptospiraceae bacterium]HMX30783.1 hypothetical protein [Leptospiraceae bacterium]HMY30143.1 hypothetical protein [Leptospiraceae bacterium]HMZ64350.1 hypothetical protein [Leptospiraceae bacterium]
MLKSCRFLIEKIRVHFLPFCLLFFIHSSTNVFSTATCVGQACNVIPQKYLSEFSNLDSTFQTQYLIPVMESMIESGIIINNNSSMIGSGYVNRFQLGSGLSASYIKKDDITINYGDITIPKLPNAGIASAPTIMGAINLGWFIGKGDALQQRNEDDDDENEDVDNKNYLHRFNLFFHGMNVGYNTTDVKAAYINKPEISGSIQVQSIGAILRYHIIEPKISSYSLISFSGLSLGIGYNAQRLNMQINHQPRTNETVSFGELKGSWIAKTEFDFSSNIHSIPIELRSGLKIFYFFDLFCGVGFSKNYGEANLHLSRGGPIKLSLDPTYIYNSSLLTSDYYKYFSNNALNPTNGAMNPEGSLAMDFRRKVKLETNTNYFIAGMEFNFAILKLLAEATIIEKGFGANLGLKVVF